MRKSSGLGRSSNIFKDVEWFQCCALSVEDPNPFYVQDTVHIAVKLRCLLLKTFTNTQKLPFGKFFIQIAHLKVLLDNFTKDKHRLTASTLDPKDKQNFESVLRICDKEVIRLLKEKIPNSEGTRKFLGMIGDVIDAYSNKDLSPLDRIEKIWYPAFILRIWREYILSKPDTNLKNNFLSQNCYTCVEINAHSLVLLMLHLRKKNFSDYFLPFLFSSQPCEGFFRQIRSFTSTYSTVANCSIKEIVGRINKIQLQGDISIRSEFLYPRDN